MISLTDDRKMLGYALLGAYPNISHFVTTRHGGYSEGAYASFNCSPFSGDELERVEKNQTLLFQSLSQAPRHLIIPFQTHGKISWSFWAAATGNAKRDRCVDYH